MIIADDISLADYHASDLISHSKLRAFAELGPYGYRARHLLGENKQDTSDAMRFGQAFETFVQSPSEFARCYVEEPIVTIKGKADDELLAEATAAGVVNEDGTAFTKRHDAKTVNLALLAATVAAQGKTTMKRADMVRIERMAENFARNADAVSMTRALRTQVTLRDDFGGLDMLPGIQARPDWYDGATMDLKTCAQFNRIDSVIVESGYNTQAALIDLITGQRFPRGLIVCESEWPFRCQVIELPRDMLDAGAEWCRGMLDRMRVCYARDEWPLCETYRSAITPRYMRRENG